MDGSQFFLTQSSQCRRPSVPEPRLPCRLSHYPMSARNAIWLVAVMGGLLVTYSSVAQKPFVQVDIAAMQVGFEPSNFAFGRTGSGAPAEWRVVRDPTAVQQAAIAQTSQWHTLGLRAEGEHFTVSFDGKELFSADDKTVAIEGKVALWTKADSVTYFDTLTIRPL
jgi:hypothetical protein